MTPLPTTGILSYLYRRSASHTHQGIDLGAPTGAPVYSVAPGYVAHASAELEPGFSGYGRHVVVRAKGGSYQLYAHLDHVDVTPGSYVRRGARLGTVGRTCFTTEEPQRLCGGAHLHFEVSATPYPQDSEASRLDPVAYLDAVGGHPFVGQRFLWGLVGAVGALLALTGSRARPRKAQA